MSDKAQLLEPWGAIAKQQVQYLAGGRIDHDRQPFTVRELWPA